MAILYGTNPYPNKRQPNQGGVFTRGGFRKGVREDGFGVVGGGFLLEEWGGEMQRNRLVNAHAFVETTC